jgi:cysteinyl-tRNA synthetase
VVFRTQPFSCEPRLIPMTLQIYSTLSRKKEAFHKKPGEPVTMYVCGPTVYKPSHIGHMVGPVIFDTVKRYLTYLGYSVTWVVNITDVDDKLIEWSKKLNTTVPELARRMTQDYFDCLKALNVTGIDKFPLATEHVGGMIEMIDKLIAKKFAYVSGSDVYFDVSQDTDYGKLCNRDPEQLEAGARLEISGKKRNPGDFALWKGAKPDEPPEVQFDSPWGKGRPGWHIECSAMSTKLLGETLDIHGGGLDLQFPHHENELAQTESATGKEFSRVWMHNGLLKLKNKDGKEDKMSGTIGNVINVSRALELMSGDALRFFVLGTHYRSPIDLGIWDWLNPATPLPDNMVVAKRSFETFPRFAERFERISGQKFADLPTPSRVIENRQFVETQHAEFYERFRAFMDDDFNTGGAVGVLFELVTAANKYADDYKLEEPSQRDATKLLSFLEAAKLVKELTGLLGLKLEVRAASLGGGDQLVAGLMQLLLDLRENLRKEAKSAAKDNPIKKALFEQTDLIRNRLAALGVLLEDRPGGTSWRVGG